MQTMAPGMYVPIEALLPCKKMSPLGERFETAVLHVMLELRRLCNLLWPILVEAQLVVWFR